MRSKLARASALALAIGMVALVVSHAGLSGCRGASDPSPTPTAESDVVARLAPTGTSSSASSAASASNRATAPTEGSPSSAAAAGMKPAPSAPRFMGASKAAPVFRDDDVNSLNSRPPEAVKQQGKPQSGTPR